MRTFRVIVSNLEYPPLEYKKAITLMQKMEKRGHKVFCLTGTVRFTLADMLNIYSDWL